MLTFWTGLITHTVVGSRLLDQGDTRETMILQILANFWQVMHNGYAMLLKFLLRSNSGKHQNLWGVHYKKFELVSCYDYLRIDELVRGAYKLRQKV